MTNEHGNPAPEITIVNAPYWEGLREHRIDVQQCCHCQAVSFPPVRRCAACLGTELSWLSASGSATLVSWTVIHQGYHPAFADRLPYIVAVVRLAEGANLVANVVHGPVEDLYVGMPMTPVFQDFADLGFTLLWFAPTGANS